MQFVSFFLLPTHKEIQILARNKIELIILIYLGLSCGRRVRRTVVICQRRDCFPAKKIMCFFQKSVFRENVIKHYESVLQLWPKLQIPQDPRNWQTNAHCDRSHYIGASELTARQDSQKARNVWTSCRCSYFATASSICENFVILQDGIDKRIVSLVWRVMSFIPLCSELPDGGGPLRAP